MTKHEAMLKITRLEGQLAQALTRAETAEREVELLREQISSLPPAERSSVAERGARTRKSKVASE